MRTLFVSLFAFAALPAWAHPGDHHEGILATLHHLFTEPDHLAMMAIALIVGIGTAKALRRHAKQKGKVRDPR